VILIDTSVWVNHLRHGSAVLTDALNQVQVLTHPFVIGELACGNLKNRLEVLDHLAHLPQAPVATDIEVLHIIEAHHLTGCGVRYIDIHLLASARLAESSLWSTAKRLMALATDLGVAFTQEASHGRQTQNLEIHCCLYP
jgi:predicted nucleic acid-binding protein